MPVVALGLLTLDVTQVVTGVPAPNQKGVAVSTTVEYGGPAANAAAAAKALGSDVLLRTMLGVGPLASVARSLLARDLIECRPLVGPVTDLPLSTVLITESTGERAVVSSHGLVPGPQLLADPTDADGAVLLLDGHYLDAAVPAARRSRDRGSPVVLDGGSWKPGLNRLMPMVDVAILSADFTGPEDGPRFVARSHGGDPIDLRGPGGQGALIPVPAVHGLVDTMGAGDVLHGAFVHYLARAGGAAAELTFEVVHDCLAHASRVATYSCRFQGAQSWRESWPE